jgi:hypothetical protein
MSLEFDTIEIASVLPSARKLLERNSILVVSPLPSLLFPDRRQCVLLLEFFYS